jgi:hypothetical protein
MISGIEGVLKSHAERYSQLQIPDVYKLLHQATQGSEHAAFSERHARLLLGKELRSLALSEAYGPFDVISGEGKILRVHLRKYISEGYSIDALFDAFIATSKGFKGNLLMLEESLLIALRLCRHKGLPFKHKEMKDYISAKAKDGYPTVHHSNAYVSAYHPAYRVVDREFLPEEITQRIQ